MALITETSRDTLIGIYITLFAGIPGAGRVAWMIERYESGISEEQIADALMSAYPEEFAAVAPEEMQGIAVGSLVAERLLGEFASLVPANAWVWARQWAMDMSAAGAGYSEVLVQAVKALSVTANPNFAAAQALLENRIAVAKHVALDAQQNPVNLIEAQDLIAFVDHLPASVDTAKAYWLVRQQAGVLLTGAPDSLTGAVFSAFPVYGPGVSSALNTLQSGDVLTGSGALATLNAGINLRNFSEPQFAPVLNDIAVFNLWVTGGQLLGMDLQNASGLQKFTINSAQRVDVHGLRTDGQADGRLLEIDARGAAGELLLFVDAPVDVEQLNATAPEALRDLVIRTGAGAANISLEGELAGSIEGGRGGVNIDVVRAGSLRDLLGISSIHSAVGTVTLVAADMRATASDKGLTANQGFDDIEAADIAVASGRIYVEDLLASQDWDGTSGFRWIGASIATTGGAADIVNFRSMADGTRISLGAGDDMVRVMELSNQTVLAADSDNDGRGAVLDLGEGYDSLSFLDLEARGTTHTVLVGRDALVQGAEWVGVEALDRVSVTTLSSVADTRHAFVGTRFLELEIENQTVAEQGDYFNDDNEHDASIDVDLLRFDAALELVMMISHESPELLVDGDQHSWRPGAPTAFTIHNARVTTELRLGVGDVTSHLVTPNGVLINDTLLSIDRLTGSLTLNPGARDHSLWLSHADTRGMHDRSGLILGDNLDLDLTLAPTSTDTAGDGAAATDDDSMLVEHFTLSLGPGSPSIDFNGFGDLAHRPFDAPVQSADVSSPVATSLAINGLGSSDTVVIDAVNADTITLNQGISTHASEGALVLRVDAPNNYRIQTISGNDILDLRVDSVRADDNDSAVDRADHVDTGGGFDTLIISGDNHLGTSDLQRSAPATAYEDKVFTTLAGIEEILIDTDHGRPAATQMLVLDAAAANRGLEQFRFVGRDTHTLHMTLGENYAHVSPSGAAQTLLVDAGNHQGDFNLVLDSSARPGDGRSFNLALHLRAAGESAVSGDNLLILDSGDEWQSLDVTLTTASRSVDTQLFDGVASDVGHVALTVAQGSIDSITLVDGGAENAAGMETTSDSYLIASGWTLDKGLFRFDGSAIADTDNDTSSGGLLLSAQFSDAGRNTLLGSQNDDQIIGSAYADTIWGGGGNDALEAGAGNDILDGGAGVDSAIFAASRSSYQLTSITATTLTVGAASNEGQDLLLAVERLHFKDVSVAFDLAGAAGQIVKTIGAVFGAPLADDARIVGIGLSMTDAGLDAEAVMTMAINSRLQQDTSAARVVELLYTNVAGVAPDADARARFVALLEDGTFSVADLGMFAADHDLNTSRIGLVGLAQTGVEYLRYEAQM